MYKKGFSLVELSIVLIIIGLLIAGVTAGSKLIRQAKLQKFINVLDQLDKDFYAFRLKYDGLPGDLKNAVEFGLVGVNGNGNYEIDSNETRSNRLWTHLSSSNISRYGFKSQTTNPYYHVDVNAFINLSITFNSLYSLGDGAKNSGYIYSDYNDNLEFEGGIELSLVDKKVDRAISPLSGKIRGASGDCVINSGSTSISYNNWFAAGVDPIWNLSSTSNCTLSYIFDSLN